jgi:phosphatidylserine/phosphatidylglycerophosphate/cardiolipin synthase-like enzyme
MARDTTTDLPYPSGKALEVRKGNEVLPLVDGPETYQNIYDAIRTTLGTGQGERYYIYILAWWMDDSIPLSPASPHSTLNDLLTQAAGEKVEIRILVWKNLFRLASHPLVAKRISALKGAACLVDETPHWRSHHQKVVLMKGRQGLIGFCGGLDIAFRPSCFTPSRLRSY